jgi:hypothetical protein
MLNTGRKKRLLLAEVVLATIKENTYLGGSGMGMP